MKKKKTLVGFNHIFKRKFCVIKISVNCPTQNLKQGFCIFFCTNDQKSLKHFYSGPAHVSIAFKKNVIVICSNIKISIFKVSTTMPFLKNVQNTKLI